MSRRGLIIRVLIFVPLFAYFGYGAYQKWRSEQAEERAQAEARSAREAELQSATRSITLHDGRSIDIVELTPEQAERLHGIKLPADNQLPADDKAPGPAPTTAAPTPAPDTRADVTPPDATAPTPAPAAN